MGMTTPRIVSCRAFLRIRAFSYRLLVLQVLPEYLGVRSELVQELRIRLYRIVCCRDPLLVTDLLKQLSILNRDDVRVLPPAIVRIQLGAVSRAH